MRLRPWVLGIGIVMTAALALAFQLDRRSIFLPGKTTDGHRAIETSCNSCHAPFASVPNKNCTGCHEMELKEDTHPVKLFDDPRWAEMLQNVNAMECVNCHREHQLAARGVTVDLKFCFPCHDDVTVKRASHRDLSPNSCWDGGCHNYHDNSGLNIAFLKKRFGRDATPPAGAVFERAAGTETFLSPTPDAPALTAASPEILAWWRKSLHAQRDVNCSECHGQNASFLAFPEASACSRCHTSEAQSFQKGKHGARLAVKLPSLIPGDARRPMKQTAAKTELTCSTCHEPHSVDTRRAAVEACLGCHDDRHSKNFKGSKHEVLFSAETGARPSATAVTCATCHMPRLRLGNEKTGRVVINHNNSWTLQPRDRMIKEVCLACHTLELALNSMFDEELIQNNFKGTPKRKHDTLTMVEAYSDEKTGKGGN
jgi:predicted CXXCH cytochrome family protein